MRDPPPLPRARLARAPTPRCVSSLPRRRRRARSMIDRSRASPTDPLSRSNAASSLVAPRSDPRIPRDPPPAAIRSRSRSGSPRRKRARR
eukprot:31348-Pelagococcus_subviridis.AAC.18